MARLVFLSVAVFLAVVMLSSESMSLPVAESIPALTIHEAQQHLIGHFANQKECKKVGERCYVAEECCTKRCLSFAAKCVT